MNHKYCLKIGIIRTTSIGDVVIASSCINLLYSLNRKINIYWFGNNPSLDIIKHGHPNVAVVDLKNSSSTTINENLKKLDILIDLQVNFRSLMLVFKYRLKSKKYFYLHNKSNVNRLSLILKSHPFGRFTKHHSETIKNLPYQYQMFNKTIIKALHLITSKQNIEKISASIYKPKLQIAEESFKDLFRLNYKIQNTTLITIAPGASYSNRKPPTKALLAVCSEIINKFSKLNLPLPSILLIGDHNDKNLADIVENHFKKLNVSTINFVGKLSLLESTYVVGKTKVVLCSDSSMAHISEAQGVPVVTLFGPTSEKFGFAPHLSDSKFFSSSIGCRPCSKHGKTKCRYNDQKCFTELDPKEISQAIINIIKKP